MRGRFISRVALLVLVELIALARLHLLVLPFGILATVSIAVPDKWSRLTLLDKVSRTDKRQDAQRSTTDPPRPPGRSAAQEIPKASEAAADPARQSGQGATLTIARISSDGPSVFGGTAEPFAQVTVLDGATAVATGTANDRGDWSVVTEYKFANTDPKISVREDNALPKAATAAPDNASPASSSTTVADHVPPAAQFLKNFENLVAETREEARKQGSATTPLKDEAPNASASAVAPFPASPSAIPMQPQSIANPAQRPRSPPANTVLIPITFVYNEATLTPEGQGAARLLLEYLKLKKFASVTLSGHADERGLPNYNMELSHQRLITVEHVLREGGFEGKLDLIPKGSTEPFTGIDRSKFSPEEVYQLDRRVELRVAN